MSRYNVDVPLSEIDGSAFSIMGAVSKALKRAGVTGAEIATYREESMAGDYDNLLQVAMKWVNVT